MSFRAQRGISPFAKRKGLGGCPRHSREGENPKGRRGGEIMAIMVHHVILIMAFPVIPSATPCHSERSEESPPFAKRKGARGMLIPPSVLHSATSKTR